MRYSPSVMGLRFFSRCPVAKADDEGRHKNAQPGAGEGVAGKVIIRTQQTARSNSTASAQYRGSVCQITVAATAAWPDGKALWATPPWEG